jgi:hypothetical protein
VRDDMAVDVTVNGGEPRGYVSVARCRNGQGGGFLIVLHCGFPCPFKQSGLVWCPPYSPVTGTSLRPRM